MRLSYQCLSLPWLLNKVRKRMIAKAACPSYPVHLSRSMQEGWPQIESESASRISLWQLLVANVGRD